MNEQIVKVLTAIINKYDVKLKLRGNTLHAKSAFSDIGLMPAIAKRADQICTMCLGYGIGVSFTEASSSILGLKVQFDDVTPSILRICFLVDVLMELIQNDKGSDGAVVLDELLYD